MKFVVLKFTSFAKIFLLYSESLKSVILKGSEKDPKPVGFAELPICRGRA